VYVFVYVYECVVVCVESVSVWRRESESLSPTTPINASVVTIVLNHSTQDGYCSLHLPLQAELRNDVLYLLPHPPPVAPLRTHYCPQ